MLEGEIGVAAEAVAGAFDLEDDGVVYEAIKQCRCDDRIAEHFDPLGEAAVRCEDHRALIIVGVDELEEQVGPAGGGRQTADLVDDEQRGAGAEPIFLASRPSRFAWLSASISYRSRDVRKLNPKPSGVLIGRGLAV